MTNSMPQVMPAFVHVIGIRHQRFIEFEYMVGSPDLCIELIMPIPAFIEFCERENAAIDDEAGLLAAARAGNCPDRPAPGLYRQPTPQEH